MIRAQIFSAPCDWVSLVSGQPVPDGAVVGGYDAIDPTLYVARAYHEGHPIPGKFVPSHRMAYIPYSRHEHAKPEYEILCNGNVSWIAAANGYVPPNAVVGGITGFGELLYIGRASFCGTLTPGSIQPSHRSLYISFAGREIPIEEYEVLVERK